MVSKAAKVPGLKKKKSSETTPEKYILGLILKCIYDLKDALHLTFMNLWTLTTSCALFHGWRRTTKVHFDARPWHVHSRRNLRRNLQMTQTLNSVAAALWGKTPALFINRSPGVFGSQVKNAKSMTTRTVNRPRNALAVSLLLWIFLPFSSLLASTKTLTVWAVSSNV